MIGILAITVAVLGVGFLLWLMRGGRAPAITANTTGAQMVGRGVMASIAGVLLIATILCGLVDVAHDWDANPEHLEEFSANVHTTLSQSGWWKMSTAEHDMVIAAFLPVVIVVGLLIGWGVASLFI